MAKVSKPTIDLKEIRDLLMNAPDSALKKSCEISGTTYNANTIKQLNIAVLLTSKDINNHLDKIRKIVNESGLERNNSRKAEDVVDRAQNQVLIDPRDNIAKEQDPHYRMLTDVATVDTTPGSSGTVLSNFAWIGVSNGWANLCWSTAIPEKYDWVGLYNSQNSDTNSYIFYSWADKSYRNYVSNQYFVSGLSIRYFRWNVVLKCYQELFRSSNLDLNAEVEVDGEKELTHGCWVSPTAKSNTYINWHTHPGSSSYDWVGLFPNRKAGDGDYKTYQWATKSSPYDTGYGVQPGYHARYYIWDASSKNYICKRRSIPIGIAYMDLDKIYGYGASKQIKDINLLNENASNKMWDILVDQLWRAFNGEASVFAAGYYPDSGYPFGGTNLLWKNLSYQEVLVIGSYLKLSQYKQCLMVYYNTYKMAISIADNDERNAKRHVFWQISMAQAFDENFANAIGDAHEQGRPGSASDNAADKFNNKAALDYWKENPSVSPLDAANHLWEAGALKGIDEERLEEEL